jgi:integrase
VRFKTDEKTFDDRDYRRDNPLSFANASERYKEHRKPDIKRSSYRSMSNHFDKAQAYFKDRNVKDLDYADFEDFLKTLEVGGKTKKNVLTTIEAMYRWLKKRREIKEVPVFPDVDYELGYRKTIDKETQQAIIDDIKQHEPFKVWLGIKFLSTYISIRPMELMNVKWSEVDLKNGYIYIPHPKEKKFKSVPILSGDVLLLKGLPAEMPGMFVFGNNGKRFGQNRFYKAWRRASNRCGVDGVDLYGGTRHSSARALREFFSPEQIKRATMHSTNEAFERYFTMEAEDVRSIYQRSAEVIKIDTALTPDLKSVNGQSK